MGKCGKKTSAATKTFATFSRLTESDKKSGTITLLQKACKYSTIKVKNKAKLGQSAKRRQLDETRKNELKFNKKHLEREESG